MAFQIYERGAFFFDGQLLVELVSYSVDVQTGMNEVNTLSKGFAGMSPGSEKTMVEVTEALPRAGFDFAALSKAQGLDVVEFVCFLGGEKLKCKGFITGLKISGGADKAAEISFNFTGGPLESTGL